MTDDRKLTRAEVNAITQRLRNVTSAPWLRYDTPKHYGLRHRPELAVCRTYGKSYAGERDLDFIAAARTDVPRLCAELEAAMAMLSEALPFVERAAEFLNTGPIAGPVDLLAHEIRTHCRAWDGKD